MTEVPTNIKSIKEAGVLEIRWPDGSGYRLPFRFLRGRCPCAACVNEFTGERVVGIDGVPEDVRPVNISFSGNYALKIDWDDQHTTGLYTWEYLRRLCQSDGATPADRG